MNTTARVTMADEMWPAQLRGLAGMPDALYVRGDAAALRRAMVAVVGTRAVSTRGRAAARSVALALAARRIGVASGLALGVDGEAHEAALTAGVHTVAVLAHGLDRVYPAAHAGLAQAISTLGGALVSEHPDGVGARPKLFVLRNRIISALARALVVVETSPDGGAMHAGRFALKQGRRVVALVPEARDGEPFDSSGCRELVGEGAVAASSIAQVLEALAGVSWD